MVPDPRQERDRVRGIAQARSRLSGPEVSVAEGYSVAVVVFWAVGAAAGARSWLLARGAEEINGHSAMGG